LKDIADVRGITMTYLVSSIDADRKHANLSSAIRLFVLDHYKSSNTGTQLATTKLPYVSNPTFKAAS
jgi:predicted DNA-binding ribbon-helix-helix protein